MGHVNVFNSVSDQHSLSVNFPEKQIVKGMRAVWPTREVYHKISWQLCLISRIVEMTAEVLGVPYEFKKCDLMAGENMKVDDVVDVYWLARNKIERQFC